MYNFTTRTLFLFPSFSLDQEEQEKLDRFLLFLEESGVSKILNSVNTKCSANGGRPEYNPCHLLATILYGFAFGSGTLRDIESACHFDLRYIYLMDQECPSFKTFSNFINKYIVPNSDQIFFTLIYHLLQTLGIHHDVVFIDGTKIEADANKYKFVWKPTTFHLRLSDKIRTLLTDVSLERGIPKKGIIDSKQIAEKVTEFHDVLTNVNPDEEKIRRKRYDQLKQYLLKSLEYEEKERICGPNRNSYFKTDHDATAMTLKTDYYSGLGSNMHAAYNVQIAVEKGIVTAYLVTQSRSDYKDFIPLIEKMNTFYQRYPGKICADAGYGSLENYRYLHDHGIKNFVKHSSWEGNVSGRNPDKCRIQEDGTIKCLNGKQGQSIEIKGRHPKRSGDAFYKVEGCSSCAFKDYCKQRMKIKDQDYRIFELNPEFRYYKQEGEQNLLSIEGIETRVNRSIEVEGAFGVIKEDMRYTRFRRTKFERVSTEFMLTVLGYDIRKLFRYFDDKWKSGYWQAPKDIKPEKFKKPSAKRLSNRVKKETK